MRFCLMCKKKLTGGHIFVCSPRCHEIYRAWKDCKKVVSCNQFYLAYLEEHKFN